MTTKERLLIAGAIAGVLVVCLYYASQTGNLGSAGSGQAGIATSSTIAVGPQEDITIFDSNRYCANRAVSTLASAIMLSFHSAINPSASVGHLQAASTTVEYDSDLWGCGTVTAYGFSSSTITLTQFSQ